MATSANSIKTGNILVHNKELWLVIKDPDHTKPGKGGAYVQVEMKNLKTGSKITERFRSTSHIEIAYLEKKELQYLYYNKKELQLVFMDHETHEEVYLSTELIADKLPFLIEGMNVEVEFYQDNPINIELPSKVVLTVIETEPMIKGATSTASYKPAILSNGIKIMVPQYIQEKQKIVVKTEDATYIERVMHDDPVN